MPSTKSPPTAYTISLREQAKEQLRGENWNKYPAMILITSVKNLGLRAKTEEEAGNFAEAYMLYYKATEILTRIICHPEYKASQREKGVVWQAFKDYEPTFGPTILEPATRVSERLKAMERQKIDKVDGKDAPRVL